MPGSSPAGVTLAIVQQQYSRLLPCMQAKGPVDLLIAGSADGGFDSPWSPHGWVCLAARAADCKSVTRETSQVRVLPHPLMFACPSGLWCFPAKEVYGNVPEVRILPQTLCSDSPKDRIFGYEPEDTGSIPVWSIASMVQGRTCIKSDTPSPLLF